MPQNPFSPRLDWQALAEAEQQPNNVTNVKVGAGVSLLYAVELAARRNIGGTHEEDRFVL